MPVNSIEIRATTSERTPSASICRTQRPSSYGGMRSAMNARAVRMAISPSWDSARVRSRSMVEDGRGWLRDYCEGAGEVRGAKLPSLREGHAVDCSRWMRAPCQEIAGSRTSNRGVDQRLTCDGSWQRTRRAEEQRSLALAANSDRYRDGQTSFLVVGSIVLGSADDHRRAFSTRPDAYRIAALGFGRKASSGSPAPRCRRRSKSCRPRISRTSISPITRVSTTSR